MRYVLGVILGAAVGAAAWFFGRCTSGHCPITGNPYVSMLIFSAMGVMLAARPGDEQKSEDRSQMSEKDQKKE